jgi:hypothetical protein
VWWDSYCDTHEDSGSISWEEFTEAFHEHHVPEGVMDANVEEFHNISCNTPGVSHYLSSGFALKQVS